MTVVPTDTNDSAVNTQAVHHSTDTDIKKNPSDDHQLDTCALKQRSILVKFKNRNILPRTVWMMIMNLCKKKSVHGKVKERFSKIYKNKRASLNVEKEFHVPRLECVECVISY